MKNYNWGKFTRRVVVYADMKILYNYWTSAGSLENWFLKRANFITAEGYTRAKEEICEAGDSYEWEWYGYDFKETGTVLEVNGKDIFRFTFAGECEVTVKFTQHGDYTLIEITQENIPLTEEAKVNTHLECSLGWLFYLVNIKSLAEGGIDLRNKKDEIRNVINS